MARIVASEQQRPVGRQAVAQQLIEDAPGPPVALVQRLSDESLLFGIAEVRHGVCVVFSAVDSSR